MTIHYNLTPQDAVAWGDWYARNAKDYKQLIFRFQIFGSLLLIALMLLLFPSSPWTASIGTLFGVLCFAFLFPPLVRALYSVQARKVYSTDEQKKLLGPQTLEINEEGLIGHSEHVTSLIKWSLINQIIVTEDHAFLRISKTQTIVIPRATVEEANFDAFVAEVKRLHALATGAKVAIPVGLAS